MLAQGKVLAVSAALSPELIDRLVKIIVMFSSPNDGDIVNAGRALQRQLASAQTDIHAVAAHLKAGGGLSDDDKTRIKAEIANRTLKVCAMVKRGRTASMTSATQTAPSTGGRSRCSSSATRAVSRLALRARRPSSSSPTWRCEPSRPSAASPHSDSMNGCTTFSSSSAGRSREHREERVMTGIPFVLTTRMKDGLRHRGLADADIERMTPGEAHKLLMTPDPHAVRDFFEIFVTLAQKSLGGHPAPGCLQMSRKCPDDDDLVPTRYRLDNANLVERMTHDALVDSEAGHNVYVEGRLVDFGVRGKRRGELKSTTCCFALVVDSDADKNMAWTPPAGVRPTLVVETSPDNAQYWFFFERALTPARAQRLGEDLRRVTGGDSDTGNPTQPYRIPGTTNFPNKVKVARGRVITPTLFLGAAPCP
jgi:RepB DNA-primase from phage plasmid